MMMNKPFPGLYPLTVYELNEKIFLYICNLVQRKSRRKDANAEKVLRSIDFLERSGARVRSIRGDRSITSIELAKKLGDRKIAYVLPVKANSVLREHLHSMKWIKIARGEYVALKRRVKYGITRTPHGPEEER